ncbi:SDR family NAD(P)-dependent oxidoreductase [Solwaraspora sp. WMMD406]|uniref:SDR family oxidoreductase n=1 Tax=Solwaraspora sp. WMMD406 TaxID=3016095 RepID=UPI0024169C2D|nr:SDR family oxidoreductase [Solwaraspora sp. WMMD406]MDG4765862.1 SDR family NAD(P)-dependent oxidoreductase [Solwaraspora sp. WMMD406]
MKIKDSVAVVTGGASGMGKALAEKLRDAGARGIVVADLDVEGAARVASSLGAIGLAVHADVAEESSVRELVARARERFGSIDLFVSNAGLTVTGGFEAPDEDWRRAIDVNLMAHVYAARAVVPAMLEAGHGHLLQNIAAAGVLTAFGAGPYTVAKHGAVAFAEYLAVQYGGRGLGVSCLLPQAVNTPMLAASVADHEELAVLRSFSNVLEPEEVAEIALAGVEANQLHIYPHPEAADSFRLRAQDPDKWVTEMRAMLSRRGD